MTTRLPSARTLLLAALLALVPSPASAQPAGFTSEPAAGADGERLGEVVVESEAERVPPPADQLPEVDGTKIYSGKKTTETDLKALPQISSNNYRQVFSQTPGLLTSEVTNEGFASFTYRGLGDPHESFNINVLRDGIPISADLFGYPANYYQPPLDSLDRVDFLRGGAGLIYGPQAGGAINYVPRQPSAEPYEITSKQLFGERGLYNTYNEIRGTKGNVGYLGFFHHRETDGFRKENSDYQVNNGSLTTTYNDGGPAKFYVHLDAYSGDHGEAGGLTLGRGAGLASYRDDRFQTVTPFDRLRIERYFADAGMSYEIDAKTQAEVKIFGGYYGRFSRRQNPGSVDAFGGQYDGQTNNVVRQDFRQAGLDARIKHNWDLNGEEQTFTSGVLVYGNSSPFRQELGDTPFANTGILQKDLLRETLSGAIFAENRFVFGRLRVVPGVRIENIYQNIDEKVSSGSTDLRDRSDTASVPLFGLGVSYDLGNQNEAYANVSQAYKPVAYQDAIPLATGDVVSKDLNSSHAVTYETGVRGKPFPWIRYDASVFYVRLEDQFGRVANSIQNVGNSRSMGIDLGGDLDLIGVVDNWVGTSIGKDAGALRLYGNAELLDAEFTSGPVDGQTPQYAPDSLVRAGVIYDRFGLTKLALLGTFVDAHFADDADTSSRRIPSYNLWDLTAETAICGNVSLVGGVNNLFNENYYARIRSNGIDPGLPRNAYGGVVIHF